MNPAPLQDWLGHRTPAARRFPYDRVVDAYQQYGKQLLPRDWMTLLQHARERLPNVRGPQQQLTDFLTVALDKVDHRFDYRTYLGLCLLPIPDPDTGTDTAQRLLARRDRLHVLLLADLAAFELRALDSASTPMSHLRPTPPVVGKRLRHAMRAASPALHRLSFPLRDVDDPLALARRLVTMTGIDRTPAERLTLRITLLPVSTIHDEWLFLRTLQAFEVTLGLLAVDLTRAVTAVGENRLPLAGLQLTAAASLLQETTPLWSMLATMQPQAFHRFRVYTDGASAIQSHAFKLVESLCRTPDPPRLHSAAYLSVPDVQARIRDGQISLDDALTAIRAGRNTLTEHPALRDGMRAFTTAMLQWRRTHYRLAVRMLGTERAGTGGTPGTPYLLRSRDTTIFGDHDPHYATADLR
ncbi:tryptophan 2,3-dioxygenase family protein [Micromonospora sp. HUAS LYJ1]|uniref:tryptophan 2,3-dioxygenase family protein n=1 Tax=Micromonospora sp. HUAS LYJ1 TaxID=3061626 RepID=UPI0026725D4E|nr:tryptophan 2,3-dioxygenase family protein [Micromonospora sp. HUAS LYJ1]WKU03491.1 tryptophan 2,3-dioxygenase family protein [Micromonospora sp. HUAS LYJ1]